MEHNLRFSHRVFGWVAATVLGGSTYELFLDTSRGEVTTSRAAVAQGGGCKVAALPAAAVRRSGGRAAA